MPRLVMTPDGVRTINTDDEPDGLTSSDESLEAFLERVDQDDSDYDDDDEEREHPSYEQVMLDVNRCAGRLKHLHNMYVHVTDDNQPPEDLTEDFEKQKLSSEEETQYKIEKPENTSLVLNRFRKDSEELNQEQLKRRLAKLIVKLLICNPSLHYYQGFHDVCLTYMVDAPSMDYAFKSLNSLVKSHFCIFMRETMQETQDFMALIPIIIGLHDVKVQEFLQIAEVGTIFALSWVITWFSHVIPNQIDLEYIFCFLEDEDPHMILYLCAEIVIYKKDRILELEPEMSIVHQFLSQIPRKEQLPIRNLLNQAKDSFNKWPPNLVKEKLTELKQRSQTQLTSYSLLSNFTDKLIPCLTNFVSTNSRTAVLVLVLASAIALQFDRWRS